MVAFPVITTVTRRALPRPLHIVVVACEFETVPIHVVARLCRRDAARRAWRAFRCHLQNSHDSPAPPRAGLSIACLASPFYLPQTHIARHGFAWGGAVFVWKMLECSLGASAVFIGRTPLRAAARCLPTPACRRSLPPSSWPPVRLSLALPLRLIRRARPTTFPTGRRRRRADPRP